MVSTPLNRALIQLFCLIILIALSPAPLIFAEDEAPTANLTADQIFYTESGKKMIASQNVRLNYKNVSIEAPELILDVENNTISGTGNIKLKRNADELNAESIHYNIEDDAVEIRNVQTIVRANAKATDNIYLSAEIIEDLPDVKKGFHGLMTTCDYPIPHYFVSSERFEYYPDNCIVGHNVFFYNPIFFIPFGFWTPMYVYYLGKRNVILLVPMIGRNDVEGWFAKNTLDYFYGPDKKGQVYVDWTEKKGVGLGWRHHYQIENYEGSLYYYGMPEKDTGLYDHVASWDQTTTLSPELSLRHTILDTDTYRITGGRKQDQNFSVGINYKNIGEEQKLEVKNSQDFLQKISQNAITYDNIFNSQKVLGLSYSSFNNLGFNSRYETGGLTQSLNLPFEIKYNSNIRYTKSTPSSIAPADEALGTQFSLQKPLDLMNIPFNMTVNLDYTIDPDGDTVTSDRILNYVEKMPELIFDSTQIPVDKNFTLQQRFLIGRYHENRSLSVTNQVRSYTTEKFGSISNLVGTFRDLPFGSAIRTQHELHQFGYSPGDVLRGIKQAYTYQSDWWQFLQSSMSYTDYAYAGNSPFFFDETIFQKERRIGGTMTLYYEKPSKYRWDHRTGWDYLVQKRIDYTTSMTLIPSSIMAFNINSGYKFPENRLSGNDIFYDLTASARYTPTQNTQITFDLTYDLNFSQIRRLGNRFIFTVGDTWESRWDIDANFQYDIPSKTYKLQAIRLVKDLHERLLAMSYDMGLNEYKFIFTIKAFPDDPFGFSSNKNEAFKLEGIFNDPAVERF